jgi:hypothetical protein
VQPFAADLPGTPPIGSADFWGQPFRVPAAADPDAATAQTIGIMCGHVKNAAADSLVQQTAASALKQFGMVKGSPMLYGLGLPDQPAVTAGAAWWWCKLYINFVHHEMLLRKHLGESGHLQGLISPEVLVRMEKPEGDCAIFSECIAAFLTVFGIPYEFVTVAVNRSEPEIFSHVYLYAVLPDGSRLPLDASHGTHPGWQVPSGDVFRRQVWDSDGNAVADRGSRFDGLHNYGLRGMSGFGAAGDCLAYDELGVCTKIDGGTQSYDVPVHSAIDPNAGLEPGAVWGPVGSAPVYADPVTKVPGYAAPSQNSAQWASFANTLLKSGLTLAEINAIQPGTVVGPNGQILRQAPGFAVPVGSAASLALAPGSLSSMLPWLLLAGGAFLFMSMAGKKG